MTRLLPDDVDLQFSRVVFGLLPASAVVDNLIGVHDDSLQPKRGAAFGTAPDFLVGAKKSGHRVTGAGCQGHDFKMDMEPLLAQELIKQLSIGLF